MLLDLRFQEETQPSAGGFDFIFQFFISPTVAQPAFLYVPFPNVNLYYVDDDLVEPSAFYAGDQ